MTCRFIYLVPGFFGFTRLGAINYFNGVSAALESGLRQQGIEGNIIECATQPTGSITHQAARLVDEIVNSGGLEADEIHFVGHSTGGLDVRLLVSPGVKVRGGRDESRIGDLTRSVITMATPHYGTPLANFFTSVNGRAILQILTILATSRQGRATIFLVSRLLGMMARLEGSVRLDQTFLMELSDKLLDKLTLDPKDPIWQYLREIASDQGAIIQLTPEGAHLFNAAATDRPGVGYFSLLTMTPAPKIFERRNFSSVDRALRYLLFSVLHGITAKEHRHYPYPALQEEPLSVHPKGASVEIDSRTNDGVVPTMSQAWGRIDGAVVGDHLDIVGQYGRDDEPLRDWLPSGTRFDQGRFEEIWRVVANTIAEQSA
jgi:hypothetical protein